MEVSWLLTNLNAQEPTLSPPILKMTSWMKHIWKVNAVSGSKSYEENLILRIVAFTTSLRVLEKKLIGSELVYLQLKTGCVGQKMSIMILKETFNIWNPPHTHTQKN